MQLAGELDWVAKLKLLQQYRDRDGLDWDDAKLHLIDLQYADIRPEKGLYAKLVAPAGSSGCSTDAAVEKAMHDPPEDTRAYFRGRCLEKYAEHVAAASWDSVIFDLPGRESLQRVPDDRPAARQQGPCGRPPRRVRHRSRAGLPAQRPLIGEPVRGPGQRRRRAWVTNPVVSSSSTSATQPRRQQRRVVPVAPRRPGGSA